MSRIIHVPQGRSARMTKATLEYGIVGLYTCGFTSCNIIAAIGKDKLVLVHADPQTYIDDIIKEIEWAGPDSEIILIYRDKWQKVLTPVVLKKLATSLNKKIILKKMDDQHDGVFVSFDKSPDNDIHPNIKKLPLGQNPDDLLSHPKEQAFLAVQKIEQLIGLRARVETQTMQQKQLNIFDGRAWEPICGTELQISCLDPMTQAEIDIFNPSDDCLTVAGKLSGVAEEANKTLPILGGIKEMSLPIAFYLEGFLNDFDALKLLKRNLGSLIDPSNPQNIRTIEEPISAEDKAVLATLSHALKNTESSVANIEAVIVDYKESAPSTPFKKQIVDEYNTFHGHYDDRMMYVTAKKNNIELDTTMKLYSKNAKEHYLSGNFEGAINLYMESLKLCTLLYEKDDINLATAYYNIGRSFFKAEKYEESKFFLNAALLLHKEYLNSPPKKIEKIVSSLSECLAKLGTSSQTHSLHAERVPSST